MSNQEDFDLRKHGSSIWTWYRMSFNSQSKAILSEGKEFNNKKKTSYNTSYNIIHFKVINKRDKGEDETITYLITM